MVRISLIALCVVAVTLITLPFAHAYVVGQGNRTYFSGGAACPPQGCPPPACQPALPEPCGPIACGMPMPAMPMPSRISKCKEPPAPSCMPSCMPAPCPPPMCAAPACPPPCKPPVAWY
jgi:hypothetical protein